jgi:hypothetical protein
MVDGCRKSQLRKLLKSTTFHFIDLQTEVCSPVSCLSQTCLAVATFTPTYLRTIHCRPLPQSLPLPLPLSLLALATAKMIGNHLKFSSRTVKSAGHQHHCTTTFTPHALVVVLALAVVGVPSSQGAPAKFVHPGVLIGHDQLEFVRAQAKIGGTPENVTLAKVRESVLSLRSSRGPVYVHNSTHARTHARTAAHPTILGIFDVNSPR